MAGRPGRGLHMAGPSTVEQFSAFCDAAIEQFKRYRVS
jgi:hypothetical protein